MIKSQEINNKRTEKWIENGYPVIIDITGRDIQLVQRINSNLKHLGYDTGLLYVNTSLETSLQRNRQRARQADPEYLKQAWQSAYNNIDQFRVMFGNRFYLLDNDRGVEPSNREVNSIVRTVVGGTFSIENPIGKQKIRNKVLNSPIRKERSWLKNVGI